MTSGSYVCGARLWNAGSKFQTLVTSLLVNKKLKWKYPLSYWNKRNMVVTKLVGFIFRHFGPAFPCGKREKRALFSWWHLRKRYPSLIFSDDSKMPTLGSTGSSGNLGKCCFQLDVGPSGWDFPCPHWTSVMDSIYLDSSVRNVESNMWRVKAQMNMCSGAVLSRPLLTANGIIGHDRNYIHREQMPGWDFAHARYESESVYIAHNRRHIFVCRDPSKSASIPRQINIK